MELIQEKIRLMKEEPEQGNSETVRAIVDLTAKIHNYIGEDEAALQKILEAKQWYKVYYEKYTHLTETRVEIIQAWEHAKIKSVAQEKELEKSTDEFITKAEEDRIQKEVAAAKADAKQKAEIEEKATAKKDVDDKAAEDN